GELGFSQATRRCAALAAGALLVVIPYGTFFLIPYGPAIRDMLTATHATGGIAASYRNHATALAESMQLISYGRPTLLRPLFFPLGWWKIPPLLVALPVLLALPSTRRLALAGAALPLFVLLGVQRKTGAFYLLPEFVFYLTALLLLAGLTLR